MSSPVRTITIAELRQQLDGGTPAVLVDVRTPGEFAAGHIAGARNLPLGSAGLDALARELRNGAAAVFVLCASGGRSRRACETLLAAGLPRAASVDGGTQAWAAAGWPLERSAGGGTISLERQVRIAAGLLVLIGCALGAWVHGAFFGLAAFVGAGLVFAGVTDFCGMGLLLARMPWNRRG